MSSKLHAGLTAALMIGLWAERAHAAPRLDIDELNELAVEFIIEGKSQEALDLLQRIIEAEPRNKVAHRRLCALYPKVDSLLFLFEHEQGTGTSTRW